MPRIRVVTMASIVVASCALTGCGETAGVGRAVDLGGCTTERSAAGPLTEVIPDWLLLLQPNLQWFSATSISLTGDAEGELLEQYDTADVESLRPLAQGVGQPDNIVIRPEAARRARQAEQDGYLLALDGSRVVLLAAEYASGDVAFIGECMIGLTSAVLDFAQASGSSPREIVRAVAVSRDSATAERYENYFRPPVVANFVDLLPNARQIDPADPNVPRELLDKLETTTLTFDIPPTWQAVDAPDVNICGRLAAGWVQCTSLKGRPTPGAFDFDMYISPGSPLSLWLTGSGERNAFGRPFGRLINFSADQLPRPGTVVQPLPGITTVDQFIEAAESGREPVQVSR